AVGAAVAVVWAPAGLASSPHAPSASGSKRYALFIEPPMSRNTTTRSCCRMLHHAETLHDVPRVFRRAFAVDHRRSALGPLAGALPQQRPADARRRVLRQLDRRL